MPPPAMDRLKEMSEEETPVTVTLTRVITGTAAATIKQLRLTAVVHS